MPPSSGAANINGRLERDDYWRIQSLAFVLVLVRHFVSRLNARCDPLRRIRLEIDESGKCRCMASLKNPGGSSQ